MSWSRPTSAEISDAPLPLIERWGVTTTFLDRDGTINRKAPEGEYVERWSEFEFLPGALAAVAALTRAGQRIVIVTNQRGVALGRVAAADLEDIHARMRQALEAAGGSVTAIYHCPHLAGQCDCRKPEPGMLIRASRELPAVELEKSLVIGDAASDMQAADRVAARRVFIGESPRVAADLRASSLAQAVALLLDR